MTQILIRNANVDDVNFIVNSWLKSYRNSNSSKDVVNEVYFPYQTALIGHHLSSGRTLVACDPEATNVIYGWISYHLPNRLNFIYVKFPFRQLQIANRMFDASQLQTPLETSYWTPAAKRTSKEIIFNPYGVINE